jgi:hypothetical protein
VVLIRLNAWSRALKSHSGSSLEKYECLGRETLTFPSFVSAINDCTHWQWLRRLKLELLWRLQTYKLEPHTLSRNFRYSYTGGSSPVKSSALGSSFSLGSLWILWFWSLILSISCYWGIPSTEIVITLSIKSDADAAHTQLALPTLRCIFFWIRVEAIYHLKDFDIMSR